MVGNGQVRMVSPNGSSIINGYKIEKEDGTAPMSDEPDSSSFDTHATKYDDGIEDDVF